MPLVLQPEWPPPCVWDVHQGFLGIRVGLCIAPALPRSTGSSALGVLPRSTHKTPHSPKEPCCRLLGRSKALLAAPLVCTGVADGGVVMSGEEGPNWDPFSFLSGPRGGHSRMHIYTSSCAQDAFPIKFKVPGFNCVHSFPTASSSSPRLWRKVCPPLLGKMPLGTRNERFTAVLTGIQHLDQAFFIHAKNRFTHELVLAGCLHHHGALVSHFPDNIQWVNRQVSLN